jgi:imidazolonepropionase-like amidohydrolase
MKALLLGAAALLAAPAGAETIAFVGGTVAVGDGSAPIENGTVVVRDGRVVATGAGVAAPAGATVVDAKGKWVAAGMVAGFSNLGLADAGGISESNDERARSTPFAAALDVSTAINPNGAAIADERAGGLTRAIVSPATGGSIFAGQGAVIDLGADPDPVTRPRAFQYVELGEDGADTAGGSRPAAYAMLHDVLEQAADYRRSPSTFGGREKASMVKRGDAAALVPVLDGKVPLVVHVERAADIRQVLTLTRTYPKLRLVLLGATEGWMVAPEIAAARVPVLAAAIADLPEAFEKLTATESNVGRMEKAGVTVGITTIGMNDAQGPHVVAQYAGNLVAIGKVPGATGLDWAHAFASISSGPAKALGMDGEIGSLLPGRRGDVVVWDGDPLELSSAPVAVYIDGHLQPNVSHQSELRRRYLTPGEGALPKAYQR